MIFQADEALREDAPPRKRGSLLAWLFLLLGLLVLLLLLIAAGILFAVRHRMSTSLAPLDGTLHLPGLSAPVTVLRDVRGVPHIEAANLHDLLMAQGWVTASDRLWQMDMERRLPAGEAAAVLGAGLLAHDRAERILGMRDVASRLIRTMPPDQLAQLQAYADGVNAYIEHGVLPAEFSVLFYQPALWQPRDSVLVALSMAETLDERWQIKIKREQISSRLAAHGYQALSQDLYPTGSWRDHPPIPPEPPRAAPQTAPQTPPAPSPTRFTQPPAPLLPVRDLLALAAIGEDGFCPGCRPGSNEWVVSGAHTASGKPLLSNDMHLEHQIPDIWCEADLHAGRFHAAGVTLPGLPFIAAGHNDHIAWGFTAMGGDTQDVYVEKVNAQGEYRAIGPDGARTWLPIQHERERIRVRGGNDVLLEVERTGHGPIITPLLKHEHRTLSLHWTLYDPAVKGLPLYALNTAHDWTSFRAALAHWWAPTLNVAYADDAGHIGYQAVGLIPIRADGLQPVPVSATGTETAPTPAPTPVQPPAPLRGDTPQNPLAALPPPPVPIVAPPAPGSWSGYIPFNAMPSVLDPPGGILATANARVTPDGYPYQITLEWADPYRNERIWQWLKGKKGLTPTDMLTLQTDVYSQSDQALAQQFAYAIDHAAHPSARARAAAEILRSWDGIVSINSPAAAILTTAEKPFWRIVLQAKVGAAWRLYDWAESSFAREQMITQESPAWLPPAYPSWNDFLTALVTDAIQNAPADLSQWRYGDIHTIEVQHPLWKYMPFLKTGVGPLPQSGDHTTVKQVTGDLGPSQRFTAVPDAWDRSTENILVGQSGDPMSAFYRNQWPFWYRGRTFPLPFSNTAAQAAAGHTLHLEP